MNDTLGVTVVKRIEHHVRQLRRHLEDLLGCHDFQTI
jgi:hypothetical protein